jgi:hypothetical protein
VREHARGVGDCRRSAETLPRARSSVERRVDHVQPMVQEITTGSIDWLPRGRPRSRWGRSKGSRGSVSRRGSSACLDQVFAHAANVGRERVGWADGAEIRSLCPSPGENAVRAGGKAWTDPEGRQRYEILRRCDRHARSGRSRRPLRCGSQGRGGGVRAPVTRRRGYGWRWRADSLRGRRCRRRGFGGRRRCRRGSARGWCSSRQGVTGLVVEASYLTWPSLDGRIGANRRQPISSSTSRLAPPPVASLRQVVAFVGTGAHLRRNPHLERNREDLLPQQCCGRWGRPARAATPRGRQRHAQRQAADRHRQSATCSMSPRVTEQGCHQASRPPSVVS